MIDLSRKQLTDVHIYGLCEQISATVSGTLTHLDLSGNRITHRVMEKLVDTLLRCPRLKYLNLGRNLLGDRGTRLLAPLIRNHPNLRALDLSRCGIDERGAIAISQALQARYFGLESSSDSPPQQKQTGGGGGGDGRSSPLPPVSGGLGLQWLNISHNTHMGTEGLDTLIRLLVTFQQRQLSLRAPEFGFQELVLEAVPLSNSLGLLCLELLNPSVAPLTLGDDDPNSPSAAAAAAAGGGWGGTRNALEGMSGSWLSRPPICVTIQTQPIGLSDELWDQIQEVCGSMMVSSLVSSVCSVLSSLMVSVVPSEISCSIGIPVLGTDSEELRSRTGSPDSGCSHWLLRVCCS